MITLILVLLLGVFLYCENNLLEVENYYINEDILSGFKGYKILQLSDLHSKEFGKNHNRLIKEIEKINPSIIVITGDIVDSRRTKRGDYKKIISLLGSITKLAPTYYVSGNHEHRSGLYQDIVNIINQCGAINLDNNSSVIKKGNSYINLVGVKDVYSICKGNIESIHIEELSRVLESINKEKGYSILLSHRPELYDLYEKHRYDLVLTGHVHGGQIRIPFIGGILAPSQGLFPKFSQGLHVMGDTKIIISRGLGNSLFPFRVFNRPCIVVVNF